jgi:DNA topoisomerase VI subunit B
MEQLRQKAGDPTRQEYGRTLPVSDRPSTNGEGPPRLSRTTFRTSRLLDFCSSKELIAQTGHKPGDWPLVLLKELLDNSLDACEDAGVAPQVAVTVDEGGVAVADNGPGIPPETVAGVLDFAIRVSSREAYVSPTRGAQGNALKTVLAMPFVLDGEQGRVEIAARGVRHGITLKVDRIRQEPVIGHERHDQDGGTGTTVRVFWPDSARSELADAGERFLQIADDYTFLNPHLDLRVSWYGEGTHVKATDPSWAKWLPGNPTSAHWYDLERFTRLAAAYIAHDADRGRGRTVREFVAEFDGLTGSAKQTRVLDETGLKRAALAGLAGDHEIDAAAAGRLLAAMKEHSRPVKPKRLGVFGEDNLRRRFEATGCQPESFTYKKREGETDGIPWVQETAFGYCPGAKSRRLVTGVNWSPGILNPFRELGRFGRSLDGVLQDRRVGPSEPVILLLHIACPRVEYTDRGKSAVVVGGRREEEDPDDEVMRKMKRQLRQLRNEEGEEE